MADYIDNKQFREELEKYIIKRDLAIENGEPLPKIPDLIGLMIQQLAEKIATRYNFRQYTYISEMIDEGIVQAIRAVQKYDVKHIKQNPFGYFGRVIWRAFQQVIKIEKYEHEGKMSLIGDINMSSFSTQDGDEHDHELNTDDTYMWYHKD